MRRLALLLALSFVIAPSAPRLEAKKLSKTYHRRSYKSKTKAKAKHGYSARGKRSPYPKKRRAA